jgi:hypothetical protein
MTDKKAALAELIGTFTLVFVGTAPDHRLLAGEMNGVNDGIDLDFQAMIREHFTEGWYTQSHKQGGDACRNDEFVQAVATCILPDHHLKLSCSQI